MKAPDPSAVLEDVREHLASAAGVEELGAIFDRYEEPVRQVLGILAVFAEPAPLVALDEYVRVLRTQKGRTSWNLPAGRPALMQLLRAMDTAGLITWDGNRAECHPALAGTAHRRLVDAGMAADVGRQLRHVRDRDQDAAASTRMRSPGTHSLTADEVRTRFAIRNARTALYEKQWQALARCMADLARLADRTEIVENPFWQLFMQPFEPRLLEGAPPGLSERIACSLMAIATRAMEPAPELRAWAEQLPAQRQARLTLDLRFEFVDRAMLEGDLARVREVLAACGTSARTRMAQGALAFLEGDDEQATRIWEEALQRDARPGPRLELCDSLPGCLYVMACLRSTDPAQLHRGLKVASDLASKAVDCRKEGELLAQVLKFRLGESSSPDTVDRTTPRMSPLSLLLAELVPYWIGHPCSDADLARLAQLCQRADKAGFHMLAAEFAALLARTTGSSDHVAEAARLREGLAVCPLMDVVSLLQPWECSLEALHELGRTSAASRSPGQGEADQRLAWYLTWDPGGVVELKARLETRPGEDQPWRGRTISWRRLAEQATSLGFLSDVDLALVRRIRLPKRDTTAATLLTDDALPLLIDHPTVLWDDLPGVRAEIRRSRPVLRLAKKADGLVLRLEPSPPHPSCPFILTRDRVVLHLLEFTPRDRRLAEILGQGLAVPPQGHKQLLAAVGRFAGELPVHSDVGLGEVEEIPADGRLHLRLLPSGDGLSVEARVCPLGEKGPALLPGRGARSVAGEVDALQVQAIRNLADEQGRLAELLAACPVLASASGRAETATWMLPEAQDCLEFLVQVESLPDVVLEWPQGQRFRLRRGRFEQGLRVARQGDWFAVDGSFALDSGKVLSLRRLLKMLEEAPGRFVPLGAGEFLALTEEFRRRVLDVAGYAEPHGDGIRFHPLASRAMDESLSALGAVDRDPEWSERLARMSAPAEATLPPGLEVELRDYQEEGFRWLARLAALDLGACLADDMGLGKTLQALVLLLHRAPGGPALVVAPTSVCANWLQEARRFVPTLRLRLHAGPDRAQRLRDLETGDGKFEVVVTTYTLLQQDQEALSGIRWHSLVLDEAQAIKNFQTRRSRAARALSADFRMVTTGTPIENHLLELWSLFDFVNPGLLGPRKRFTERFADPIERAGDRQARSRLKRLVHPFILRRTKSQVLDELPPRTDITLHLEMGDDERALYEAVRQEALEKLHGDDATTAEGRFRVLAEIMRLRRACCHPRLILPESRMASSRIETLAEVIDELRENRHRALVFSQFVDHLALVREHLDAHGVSYQYLDGSTPMDERTRRVEAFQSGAGDLFLISLRAGGTGLNLTGADYVIHLDPWWNPAVEDQASDRAHRIGQQRPVTVYRLVARGTIEERIVDLHRHKRDLASSLLEGTDSTARLSTEDLLKLLEEEA